jgi:hypothetical protein
LNAGAGAAAGARAQLGTGHATGIINVYQGSLSENKNRYSSILGELNTYYNNLYCKLHIRWARTVGCGRAAGWHADGPAAAAAGGVGPAAERAAQTNNMYFHKSQCTGIIR